MDIGTGFFVEANEGFDIDGIIAKIRMDYPKLRRAVQKFEVVSDAPPLHGAGEGVSISLLVEYENVTDREMLAHIADVIRKINEYPNAMTIKIHGQGNKNRDP